MDSPAKNTSTSCPTRTYGEVAASGCGINQHWQIPCVVRAIRIHFYNQICTQFQGLLEAGFVGAPESELSIALDQHNPIRIAPRNFFYYCRCPVRRVVVDHNYKQSFAIEGKNLLDSLSNGFPLIIGRNANSNFHRFTEAPMTPSYFRPLHTFDLLCSSRLPLTTSYN